MSDERRLPGEARDADPGERVPAGPPVPDRIGHEGAMGTTRGADAEGAPAAVGEHPETDGGALPPNVTRPDAAAGWDSAVDLEEAPAVVPDLAETHVPEELKAKVEAAMALYPDRRSAVIPALHAAQDVHGWCSPEALRQVAAVMRVTPAYLSSIASFYDMFNEEPVGRRHVYVCTGVACMPRRPERVLDELREEARRQGLEDTEIRNFECLGACDMAPMASVDGRYVGPLEPTDAAAIVEAMRAGEKPLPGRSIEDPDFSLTRGTRT